MKTHVITALLLLSFVPRAMAADPSLDTDEKRFSYTVGFQMAQGLRQQGLEVDADALIAAIRDVLAGEPLKLTSEEMQAANRAYIAQQEEKLAALAADNKKAGDEFLGRNAKKKDVKTTPSGLQYRIIEEGSGKKPTADDTVSVHYTGTFIDGEQFDSSLDRGQPVSFQVGEVIQGWQEVLPMMREGAKWQVFIPAELAYGEQGNNAIPPNETLIFDIELLSVN